MPRKKRRTSKLEAALEWAAAGHAIFLVKPHEKEPLGSLHRNGHLAATSDRDCIREWFSLHPDANYGIVPSAGTLVLDVDPDGGGDATLEALEEAHGKLPTTTCVLTGIHDGVRGRHVWFRASGQPAAKGMLAPGLEYKVGSKGYLLGPESKHPSGAIYESLGSPRDLADAPRWLLELLSHPKAQSQLALADSKVPVGRRHDRLVSIAGTLCRLGFGSEREVHGVLSALTHRFENPDGDLNAEISRVSRDASARWGGESIAADFELKVASEVERIEVREEARQRIAERHARSSFDFPEPGRTLADDLATPARERKFVVEDLHLAGGNSLLVSQYKSGKTTLLANLAKSLADREPFLGRFDVSDLDGRIAFWNYELDADLFREWMRDLDVKHPERIAEPLHLRGLHLPFWLPEYGDRAADWLRNNEVEFLILDPAARAWRGLVTDENDNTQVGVFTDALDAMKRAAGVPNLVLSTHTGRQQFEENAERSRGATRLEDWMDVGLYLTKDRDGRRALRAMGRDVEVEAIDLAYDGATRHIYATGHTRAQRRTATGLLQLVDELAAHAEPPTTTELARRLTGTKPEQTAVVKTAAAEGYIERQYKDGRPHDERTVADKGVALYCFLTDKGETLRSRRVTLGRSAGDDE